MRQRLTRIPTLSPRRHRLAPFKSGWCSQRIRKRRRSRSRHVRSTSEYRGRAGTVDRLQLVGRPRQEGVCALRSRLRVLQKLHRDNRCTRTQVGRGRERLGVRAVLPDANHPRPFPSRRNQDRIRHDSVTTRATFSHSVRSSVVTLVVSLTNSEKSRVPQGISTRQAPPRASDGSRSGVTRIAHLESRPPTADPPPRVWRDPDHSE